MQNQFCRPLSILAIGFLIGYSSIGWAEYTSYGSKIGGKAASGLANLISAPLEIPKNIINTTNQSNIFLGSVGGLLKGIVNMAGRIGVGITDLITFPIPTKPIAHPEYIWDDFDVDTTYGPVFRLDEKIEPIRVTQTEPEPTPIQPAQPAQYEQPAYEDPSTSDKLDTLFKERMMK